MITGSLSASERLNADVFRDVLERRIGMHFEVGRASAETFASPA